MVTHTKKNKILIVEDSEFINTTIFNQLSKFNRYDIERVFDFKQATLKLEEDSYDFILLDLNLPDAYGEELVQDISTLTKAKIIILTSEVDVQMRESLFKNGILDYLVKDKNFVYSIKFIDKIIQAVDKNSENSILIIDDSMFVCKQMQKVLDIRNYQTKIALTAHDGMEILRNETINTIILDMELPDKHGLEVLRDIKNDPKYSHIPVIVISSHNSPEIIRDSFKLGVSYFITKPFNVEEFTLKIDMAIETNRKDIEILCRQKILDEYKNAVDNSSIVSKTDSKGIITFANDRFCKLSGYSREELVGQPHNIIRHPDMPASAFKKVWETIQNKQSWDGIIKNLRKDGTAYYAKSTISPIVDLDGNIVEYIGMRTDITELEHIKEELKRDLNLSNKNFLEVYKISQEYQKAIEQSNIVIRVDIEGIITYVNNKFCDITGYTKEEVIGQNHSIIKNIDFNENEYADIYEKLKDGKIWSGQVQNRIKDGSTRYFESNTVPIISESGVIKEYLVIRHDVTDIINIHQELEDTQKEIIFKMGEVGERRSSETGFHVKRVAKYSKLLAQLIGLSDDDIDLLYAASPMHDIGKIGIPDSILMKPGKLTSEEWKIMKTHAEIGFDILKNSKRSILKTASIVAYTHHEKYDGTGYPNALAGEDIHIFGRITAVADVFDALGSDRVYKKAWELDETLDLMKKEKGKHFDPKLIDAFLDNLDQFLLIKDSFKDIM